jgi:hypothetical protein
MTKELRAVLSQRIVETSDNPAIENQKKTRKEAGQDQEAAPVATRLPLSSFSEDQRYDSSAT